jgi:hypothetical protein
MALALNNAQGELSELEVGMHALGSPLGIRDYADKVGKNRETIRLYRAAAEVTTYVVTLIQGRGDRTGFYEYSALPEIRARWRSLAELHSSPKWLWRSLVSRLVAEGWTVEQARGAE